MGHVADEARVAGPAVHHLGPVVPARRALAGMQVACGLTEPLPSTFERVGAFGADGRAERVERRAWAVLGRAEGSEDGG